ncbi:hypothetical protein AB1399_09435 [Hydrogenibacillus schlegelii]|uniref:hypothetical protein n=1 Tax=Hydrogenibacillus schlegelii TaxID=1484 RepID=UPI0012E3AB46|nr:hypothetical protein [Hydrogenibacillus schlegelii]
MRFKDELIRAKGFTSEDTYWNDPRTLQTYARQVVIEKLIAHLYQTGELHENKTIEDLEQELCERGKAGIQWDHNVPNQLCGEKLKNHSLICIQRCTFPFLSANINLIP